MRADQLRLIDTANLTALNDLMAASTAASSTSHTTHIASGAPATAITGAQPNYMTSNQTGNSSFGNKKAYCSSIQDLTNFYLINEDCVEMGIDPNAVNVAPVTSVFESSGIYLIFKLNSRKLAILNILNYLILTFKQLTRLTIY